jgi:hypothetical protein
LLYQDVLEMQSDIDTELARLVLLNEAVAHTLKVESVVVAVE